MRTGTIIGTTGLWNVGRRIAVAIAAALCLAAAPPVASRAATPPNTGTGVAPATVKVVLPDGTPAAGAVVTFGGKRYVADAQGTVKGAGIFARPRLVTGDVTRMEGGIFGFFRKPVRYAAFLPVNTAAAPSPEIRLTLFPVPDMDEVCKSCHPPKATADHTFERCVHKSGVPLKPALAARVSQFNKENDALRNAGKPAYPPIVLESRKVRTALFGETRKFLVCTSCHTNHVDSGYKAYVLMPFSDKSVLCLGCHV